MFQKLKQKVINFFKWIWSQLKDWHNLGILLVVLLVMTSPIWVCGILGFIYDSATLLGVAGAYFAFWLGPITPFWPLCIAVTLLIRKGIEKNNARKQKKENQDLEEKNDESE